jgi:ubiquinone/menaquinone biosynthesis C-methylase UbiE
MSTNGTPDTQLGVMADRFSAAAQQYAVSEQQGGDDLEAIVAVVRDLHPAVVVDIATGPGSTALALAPVAGRVVGTDVSPGMIDTARERAAAAGIANVTFEVAAVERLPFGDGEVDVVTCRIAAHHFADVPLALREIVRTLRPGGALVLLDSLAPDEAEVAAFLHQIETRRDPTHVRAYTAGEWVDMVEAAGFAVASLATYPKPKAFEPWLERGGVDGPAMTAVRELVRGASPSVRHALAIEYDDAGDPTRFADDKLLVVAHLAGAA